MTSNREQRIVVTGLGATTPLGGTATETWEAILDGQSGVRLMPFEWVETYQLPVKIAATIKQSPVDVLARVEVRRLDPAGQYGLIAAREAWADAGTPEVEPERLGVVMGSGIGGVNTLLDQWDTLREKGVRRVFPLAVPMLMPNGPAAAVSLELGARAGTHTPVSACASGAEAIGLAMEMIRSGRADVVVAGGTEAAMHPMPIAGFAAMQALSTRNDDPEGASRPYDTGRDGFVLGEGAAVVVTGGRSARQSPRCEDLRRGHRSGHVLRRLPHRGTGSRGCGRIPCDARGRVERRALAQGHRPHQRPRHLDPVG